MHIRIDGRLHPGTGLPTRETVADFCVEAVQLTGLTLIDGPHSFDHESTVQAIAILAESHVSIEVIKSHRAYFVDVFTCAPFEGFRVYDLCLTKLGPIAASETTARGDNLAEIIPCEAVVGKLSCTEIGPHDLHHFEESFT